MIDLPGSAIVEGEDSDGLIERGRHKFSAGRRKVNVQDCLDMILVHHLGLRELSHIEGVAISVFITHNEIHGLVWIPG